MCSGNRAALRVLRFAQGLELGLRLLEALVKPLNEWRDAWIRIHGTVEATVFELGSYSS